MKVSAWSNGSPKGNGAGYGVRIRTQDRDVYFDKAWKHVDVDISRAGKVMVNLSASFWGRCPELRKKEIGEWLLRNRLAPWRKGSPPVVKLTKIRGNRFRLHK